MPHFIVVLHYLCEDHVHILLYMHNSKEILKQNQVKKETNNDFVVSLKVPRWDHFFLYTNNIKNAIK